MISVGYSASVIRRQRRLRSGLLDAIDALLASIPPFGDTSGSMSSLVLLVRNLDRLLASAIDSPSWMARSPFETRYQC